ncbi:hypothetical protein SAMN04487781_3120 [Cellulosimicrobium cellulans]|nr:hypothetical protein SAMN04487781_3120 [Cellulosimicrobium cellulans]
MPTARFTAQTFLTDALREDGFEEITAASEQAMTHLREVQNAIRAATESAQSALWMAGVINKLLRTAYEKSQSGRWTAPAVDSLRSALLYASAGLDVSLKRLVRHALPELPERDEFVEERFQRYAEAKMKAGQSGGIDPKALIRVLMTKGESPRDSLMGAWVYDLTDGSAQSAERVGELAQALGVTNSALKKRIVPAKAPSKSTLQSAFEARNLIAHELDVTNPNAETRKPLESIRQYRSHDQIAEWCVELLDVTQLITNDVARRLAAE